MSELEQMLAAHCAPTLFGLKQASLFSLSSSPMEICRQLYNYNKVLRPLDLKFQFLYKQNDRIHVLVYKKDLLCHYFSDPALGEYLTKFGYPSFSLEENYVFTLLAHLKKRIEKRQEFPHEIGFFLGYPKEDVMEFIEQKGKNYKFCGYWKVYNNVEEAVKIFKKYQKCKEIIQNQVMQGTPILKLLGAA